jgi:glucokinase
VDNDANCAARAELRLGVATGVRHLVLVTLGTGIGTAVVFNREVHRGAQGMAGEFGHTTIAEGGRLCACGRRGCWEAYASGVGLVHQARELIEHGQGRAMLAHAGGFAEQLRGEHVTRAARDGDEEALALLDEFARWVGIGLANIVASLDPEMIVIGGGLIAEADLLMPRVRAAYRDHVLGAEHRAELPIEPAALGERSNALGAALMAREAA